MTFRHARRIACLVFALGLMCAAVMARAAEPGLDLADRPIKEIRVSGLKQVSEKLVRNQIRIGAGDPYKSKVVEEDIVRLTHLGRFSAVRVQVEPNSDGTITVTYAVTEQPLLSDVQTVGNKEITDQELLRLVLLRAGDPVDSFLIDRGIQEIKRAYQKEGYFVTDVTYDKELLAESGILLFRVREGPRPRIQQIKFEGNKAYTSDELDSKIKSNEAIKLIFFYIKEGELSREQLEADAVRLREFYRDRGYLDAEVGRRIDLSPDQNSAVVVFVVQEGRRYTVDKIRIENNNIFTERQIIETMALKSGDIFSQDLLRKSQTTVTDLYGKLGFIDIRIDIERVFHETDPMVDLVVKVKHSVGRDQYAPGEGNPYTVGKVSVKGNELTKDEVILRQVRGMTPGERFDKAGVERTEQRLKDSALFSDGVITVLGDPKDEERDVMVEVKEKGTGSVSFGAGVSSDAGVIGAIELTQKNFDIADGPDSFGEFFSGRAFRGAGQYFNIALQPGVETSRYSVSFREPYLLNTDYFLDATAFYFQRERDAYDEERVGGIIGLGQRFGDHWQAQIRMRGEQVFIHDIEDSAPVDVFEVEGHSVVTALGLTITRNTTDSRVFPTRGSVTELSFSRIGALGGDYDFNAVGVEWKKFWAVDEDFFGRKSVFSMRTQVGYLFDGYAPIFERLYAGGFRTLRGFDFRGVGPRGIRNDTGKVGDDPVGGYWQFLVGPEYSIPIFEDIIRFVIFSDSGTVDSEVSLSKYRVSVGAGIRIKIPFLGNAPFALDGAYPILKEDGDEVRYVSFDLAIPF